jgi:predicted nucleotidyltransferase
LATGTQVEKLELAQISRIVRDWAEGTPEVHEVRIFGSRAKDNALADSDLDLAISASDGNYVRFADDWEQQLGEATGLKVAINQYNSSTPKGEKIRGYCDDFSILLFSRQVSRAS